MKADTLGGAAERSYWLRVLRRVADPVFTHLAAGTLRASMPVEAMPDKAEDRRTVTHLEALGRCMAGIGPWLGLTGLVGEEESVRKEFTGLVAAAIDQATREGSPDRLDFGVQPQTLVDAAFLAQGLLRSGNAVWGALDGDAKRRLLACLRETRKFRPAPCNWLLFSATIEAFFASVGEDWDPMRVDYALRQHMEWYAGDGAYGDGRYFHWDYYNSFVIHPMLIDVLEALRGKRYEWEELREPVLQRAGRYAAVLERLVAPDGSFPPIGRSLAYRCGAFHLLSQAALLGLLPAELPAAQARSALTAVIHRTMDAAGTFDGEGWLTIGCCGHQPALGEGYISTGSTYLAATGLVALGLSPASDFWNGEPIPWTSQRVWSGENVMADHALHDGAHG